MYSETQWPRLPWRGLVFVAPPLLFFIISVVRGYAEPYFLVMGAAILASVVVVGLAVTKVSVDREQVRIHVYGLPFRTVSLADVEQVSVRELRRLERVGFGSSTDTSVYNWCHLRRAVQFREIGKGVVRIGSLHPEELAAAITAPPT